jgi:methylated-DNA-[protein]-cysteine S-methyltransferase
MTERLKYVVFRTKWGHFGLLGTEKALFRACLGAKDAASAKIFLLQKINNARYDKKFAQDLRKKIFAYFNGSYVDFTDVKVDLSTYGDFGRKVLTACRKIRPGRTKSYCALARSVKKPNAARAVGNILAKNPLPLIIPCHRVIRSDGKIGGFSAQGGIELKRKMLDFERKPLLLE